MLAGASGGATYFSVTNSGGIRSAATDTNVALDEAMLFQNISDAGGDLVHQPLQLGTGRNRHMAKYGRGTFDRHIHPILEAAIGAVNRGRAE
jgi:hypothetical protein